MLLLLFLKLALGIERQSLYMNQAQHVPLHHPRDKSAHHEPSIWSHLALGPAKPIVASQLSHLVTGSVYLQKFPWGTKIHSVEKKISRLWYQREKFMTDTKLFCFWFVLKNDFLHFPFDTLGRMKKQKLYNDILYVDSYAVRVYFCSQVNQLIHAKFIQIKIT